MALKSKMRSRQTQQRAFDREFSDQINAAARKLNKPSVRKTTAEELLLTEVSFIHSDEFEALAVKDLEPPAGEPLFVTNRTAETDGVIDVMASKALLTHTGEQHFFRRMNFMLYWANSLRSTLQPSRATAKSIARVQVLMQEAQRCRSIIADSNLRLVLSLARKFSSGNVEFEDLVSEGSLILVTAVDKFDYSRGFRFSTYATHSIQRHFFRRWKTQQRRTNLVQVSSPEILAELIPTEEPDAFDTLDVGQLKPIMAKMADQLDDREKHIVLERFGLGPTGAAQTLRALAADLGISKERVRQLQIKAISKLQEIAGVSPQPQAS
ncbi:MAG: sigma-70 family RNA polymerase sigma factor [Planctomycetaceae bacterium]